MQQKKEKAPTLTVAVISPGEQLNDGGPHQRHPDHRLNHSGDSFRNFGGCNGVGSKGEFLKMRFPTTAGQALDKLQG